MKIYTDKEGGHIRKNKQAFFMFEPKEGIRSILERTYVGHVKRCGDAYITQHKLNLEGLFRVHDLRSRRPLTPTLDFDD